MTVNQKFAAAMASFINMFDIPDNWTRDNRKDYLELLKTEFKQRYDSCNDAEFVNLFLAGFADDDSSI